MASKFAPFTELLSAIVDNRGRTCPVGSAGLPLIATNCVSNDTLYPSYETTRFVDEDTYRNWFRGHPEPGDVLFVCKGSPGKTNLVPSPVDFCIAQDMVAVRADPEKIFPKYLFAVLRSSVVQKQIDNMHVGTLIPHFKKGDFDKLRIPLMDEKEQARIGDLYFEMSRKIDINRRMNQTLEAMAQAIFKSWFVDFDPVKAKIAAKQECRDPLRAAMSAISGKPDAELDTLPGEKFDQLATTAALFPDEMEESELGEIPRGWAAGSLSDFASFQNGYAFKTKDWSDSGHPVVKIGNVRPGIIDISGCSFITRETVDGLERFSLKRGDLLVGMTGYVGETGLVPRLESVAYLNQRVGRISTTNGINNIGYTFCLVRDPAYKAYAESKAHGSAQANVSGKDLMDYPAVVPGIEVLNIFNAQAATIISALLSYHEASQSLAALRDTLLPKLLSGELSVGAAGEITSSAGAT